MVEIGITTPKVTQHSKIKYGGKPKNLMSTLINLAKGLGHYNPSKKAQYLEWFLQSRAWICFISFSLIRII